MKENVLNIRQDSYISFDPNTGNYTITNKHVFHDIILISVPSFLKLESELFELFGTSTEKILQIVGESAGGESAKRITNTDNLEDEIRYIFNTVSKWGFGKYELVNLDLLKGHIKFKLHNNPLATREERNGSSLTNKAKTNHYFLIGFYRGYFASLFGKRTACNETDCINKGDAFCQFEIRKLG